MSEPLRVFDLRGVYVFRYEGSVPPALESAYNEVEDRYEVSQREDLDALPMPYELVEDPDDFRVRFRGDPPVEVLESAVFVADGPMATTVLCPDSDARERAVAAGGDRVD